MSNISWTNEDTDSLFKTILGLETITEARKFFRDLLTENEIIEFSQRWKVARMLSDGVIYANIEKETGMSSTTIARIQKWLNRGLGGYKLMLRREKMNKKITRQNTHHNNHPLSEEIDCI